MISFEEKKMKKKIQFPVTIMSTISMEKGG